MPRPDPSPLSPDERALAARLAKLDGSAEPSAALDARVLAAAHIPARPMPARRRWPAVIGLAASLLLAVGVAWQLRPPGGVATSAGPRDVHYEQALRAVIVAPSAPPPLAAKRMPPIPARVDSPEPKPSPQVERSRNAAAPPETPAVLDPRASAPAAPAPPAPPPPPAEAHVESAVAPPPDVPTEPTVDEDAARAADRLSGTGHGDEPEDAVPPATADSPAVRDAWLQRIQALVDGGDIAAARASLRAFVQRYPDYVLPEDLRALAR